MLLEEQRREQERQRNLEAVRRRAELEARQKQAEEEAKKAKDAEIMRKLDAAEKRRKAQQEEQRRQIEEQKRRIAENERKRAEIAEANRRMAEEKRRQREAEEAERRREAAEMRRLEEEEEERRRQMEKQRRMEQIEARRKAEEENLRRAQEEKKRRLREEHNQRLLMEQQEERRRAEEQRQLQKAEEERKRVQAAQEEARRKRERATKRRQREAEEQQWEQRVMAAADADDQLYQEKKAAEKKKPIRQWRSNLDEPLEVRPTFKPPPSPKSTEQRAKPAPPRREEPSIPQWVQNQSDMSIEGTIMADAVRQAPAWAQDQRRIAIDTQTIVVPPHRKQPSQPPPPQPQPQQQQQQAPPPKPQQQQQPQIPPIPAWLEQRGDMNIDETLLQGAQQSVPGWAQATAVKWIPVDDQTIALPASRPRTPHQTFPDDDDDEPEPPRTAPEKKSARLIPNAVIDKYQSDAREVEKYSGLAASINDLFSTHVDEDADDSFQDPADDDREKEGYKVAEERLARLSQDQLKVLEEMFNNEEALENITPEDFLAYIQLRSRS